MMEWLKDLGKGYKEDGIDRYINIVQEDLDAAMAKLKANGVDRLIAISGTDTRKHIELMYHFFKDGKNINVRMHLDRNVPRTKTITGTYPGALLYEKEASEMLGIKIDGIRNVQHLLADGSPVYPLRRD